MAIQKPNASFGATIKGNPQNLIMACVKGGLEEKGIKNALKIIHDACPKKEDRVYLYYRRMQRIGYNGCDEYAGIRSGVKVAKDGRVLEKNINPNIISSKNLLYNFALTVKGLVSGKIQPDETVKLFK